MKRKHLVIFFMVILLIFSISNIVNAITDYTTIIRGNDNQWIQFPSTLSKSWTTNWDGYYTYDGTINNISTSENVTFQIQYSCIERTEVDEIQDKSEKTPEDSEFNQWLNSWAINKINEDSWLDINNMKIELECKLGENVQHEHLVFVKVLEDSKKSIVWQGYGDGFSRINESRKKVTLESIEITTPPTKTDYEEGELFDNTGMVITARYSDGSSKVVTNYTYTPQTALKDTDTLITIVYTENGISKEVSQKIKVKEKKDTTTATRKLPQTGEKMEIIFALIAIIVIGVVIYAKYRKMKNIL